ncbi:VOC family protein [Psychroserpens sp.]|uniref:VOC family protein n=1 Tax=Psychroserpens sp. TaxID=2020870 RepID=UPI003C74B548
MLNHATESSTIKIPNNHINYIELYANDLQAIKTFYSNAFKWSFTDYGSTYTAFSNSGLDGGFELKKGAIQNGALVILHHDNLEAIKKKIVECGGTISVDVFSFPGGKRFQFIDPSGNELAVWCSL